MFCIKICSWVEQGVVMGVARKYWKTILLERQKRLLPHRWVLWFRARTKLCQQQQNQQQQKQHQQQQLRLQLTVTSGLQFRVYSAENVHFHFDFHFHFTATRGSNSPATAASAAATVSSVLHLAAAANFRRAANQIAVKRALPSTWGGSKVVEASGPTTNYSWQSKIYGQCKAAVALNNQTTAASSASAWAWSSIKCHIIA